MVEARGCCSTQLIDGDGRFNTSGLDHFLKEVKLDGCGLSYVVVSIVGPQSSGKSTLMNYLYGPNFREMDALAGRSQTTRGIWLAKAVGIEPPTLVMDLEGTDGVERGEDDTTFERQSALFALAMSDIVLINLWRHDIGRERASNRPLLKTVFQAMMRIFCPHKITLMFVIRDKTMTPMEALERDLRNDIKRMWDSVSKPPEHQDTALSDFFKVEVVVLSHFQFLKEQFKEEVSRLRQWFFHSLTHGGLVEDQRRAVPASGFSFSSQQIWKVIKEDRDLDQPALDIMVASYCCDEIASEKYSAFKTSEEWCRMEGDVQAAPVPNFVKKLSEMIATCLAGYESEAKYYVDSVRSRKGKELEEKMLHLVRPAVQSVLRHAKSRALARFQKALYEALIGGDQFCSTARHCTQLYMSEFDKECPDVTNELEKWDTSKVREELLRDMDAHIAVVREAKLNELARENKDTLKKLLMDSLEVPFNEANDGTWSAVRELLHHQTELAVSQYSSALSSFELDEKVMRMLITNLRDSARCTVEAKARAKAGTVLISMKKRFLEILNHDSDSNHRVWTGKEDFQEIEIAAHGASLKLLSVMAVIRLDGEADNIIDILSRALLKAEDADLSNTLGDPLASVTWEQVPSSKILITPDNCRSLWRQFKAETEESVTKARAAWEARKKKSLKRTLKRVGKGALTVAVENAIAVGTATVIGLSLSGSTSSSS